MPGFWSSPKKVSSASQGASYDAYDELSGYAWNYNWDADSNQLNVALACQKEAGDEFQAETFSNSAPYFMTVSGCTSGSKKGYTTNLKSNSYQAFSRYLADVTKHLIETNGLHVTSISGMNEPESSGWIYKSQKQEGCHIDSGSSQSNLITSLSNQLTTQDLNSLTLAGTDSCEVETTTASFRALSSSAKYAVERIDTHAYMDSGMPALRNLAIKQKKNLWMSEVDGSTTAGTKAGEMSAALGFSQYLNKQLNGLQPSAWIMWDAIDAHIDSSNEADMNSLTNAQRTEKDKTGFWGILFANHDTKQIIKTKKYYSYGQYSRYIRPGYTLIGSSDNSVAAYDKKTNTVVLVAANTSASNQSCQIDLSQFGSISSDSTVTTIRTSGTLKKGENWKNVSDSIGNRLNITDKKLSTTLKGNSITTYIITNVSLATEHTDFRLKKLKIHQNQITGKTPSSGMNSLGNMVDNNYDTEYNCKNGSATIDLGSICKIDAISFVASSQTPASTQQLTFYGSTNKKVWQKLYTVSTSTASSSTASYLWNDQFLSKQSKYRYIKCKKASGKTALTEINVYGNSTASADVTKYPETLTHVKTLPQKIKLENKKSAKVLSWTFYRGKNDSMTKKQKSTILLTTNLNKSLSGYGKTMVKNVTVNPSTYKKLLGKTFTIKTKNGTSKLTQVTASKKKAVFYMDRKGNLTQKK